MLAGHHVRNRYITTAGFRPFAAQKHLKSGLFALTSAVVRQLLNGMNIGRQVEVVEVTLDRTRIGELLLSIQEAFLEQPGLELTTAQVQWGWGLDPVEADALLGVLLEARVLARTDEGALVRYGTRRKPTHIAA